MPIFPAAGGNLEPTGILLYGVFGLMDIDFGFALLLLQSPTPDPQALQAATSTDLLANIQVAFQNFLQTGQAGAMAIGVVVGYVVRGITK
jgi:hypothetical protein